jgi:hypothetical protein
MNSKSIIQFVQKFGIIATLSLPLITKAQPTTFAEFVDLIIGLINTAIPVLFGVVFLYLVRKVFDSWILNAGDEAKREDGKKYALTAVLVLVLMISAWGIVVMIRESLFG